MQRLALLVAIALCLAASGCSSFHVVRTMGEAARHAEDPANLADDFKVELSKAELLGMRKIAWIGFTVSSVGEETPAAREIAENAFLAVDRELRKVLEPRVKILDLKAVEGSSALAFDFRSNSLERQTHEWLAMLGKDEHPIFDTAYGGLAAIDPSGIGWSKGEVLATAGQQLGVDGVLVGLLRVSTGVGGTIVNGPRIWIFSSTTARPVFEAEFNLPWFPGRNWCALDEIAARMGVRILESVATR